MPATDRHFAAALAAAQACSEDPQHFFVPGLGKAPAGAVIGDLQVAQALGLQLADLHIEPTPSLEQIRQALGVAKKHFVDDREHRNFKQNRMQPRALDHDIDVARWQRRHRHALFIELEQPQKINKIALDKTHGPQVGQFGILEMQAAQMTNFVTNLSHMSRQLSTSPAALRIDIEVTALETILNVRTRKLVQHHLHHGELVQVCIEQTGNDHR